MATCFASIQMNILSEKMRNKIIPLLLFLIFSMAAHSQQGSIRGTVFDGATGEYLVGVTVFVEGTTTGTISDLDGNFNLKLRPGTYNLQISYISYQTMNLSEMEVEAGEVKNLGEIRLEEATISLNEVTITAKAVRNTEAAVISMRRKSPNVLDGISAGTIKKLGDSDAAGVLKRLSGVSVSGDKYVYVRGLGDRYIKIHAEWSGYSRSGSGQKHHADGYIPYQCNQQYHCL